jgi:hypothetical protein
VLAAIPKELLTETGALLKPDGSVVRFGFGDKGDGNPSVAVAEFAG